MFDKSINYRRIPFTNSVSLFNVEANIRRFVTAVELYSAVDELNIILDDKLRFKFP